VINANEDKPAEGENIEYYKKLKGDIPSNISPLE